MNNYKIIAIGDNVCDKYLSRGKMYPGGQCVNTCVFAQMSGAEVAYLGKYGSDEVAKCVQDTLKEKKIDDSHCRHFQGENGFALVTLDGNDRVFLGSNKGGVAKQYSYNFTKEDLEYIKSFQLVYTNLNSYIEKDLPLLKTTGIPIAYDFSIKWTDQYLAEICPYISVAVLSCAHLTPERREEEMKKVQSYGVGIVLGTIGEEGSWVLYKNQFYYASAVYAENAIDTMGAGDCYFAAFLSSLLETSESGKLVEGTDVSMKERLLEAMNKGAVLSAKACKMEGAFGYGVPVVGRTEI